MRQHYKIAGLTVEMDTFGRAAEQARAYLTEDSGTPDIVITNNAQKMQSKHPSLSLDESEYVFTCFNFYFKLLDFDGMMLHASAVVKDGFAFLFSAASGTGKSTHTELWQALYGADRVLMLNDDKPALRLENGRWYAYGTPWSGKNDRHLNMRVPLGGICILERGEKNEIKPHRGARAVFEILDQTLRPDTVKEVSKLMELLNDLMEKVPIWKLKCNMDQEAARVSHDAMYQAAKERWPEE